jgi:integrase
MANHAGSYDRHGARWRLRLSVAGKRHVFYLDGSTSEEDVQQYLREKHTELHRRNGTALPGPMPFSELLERYKASALPQLAPLTQKSYATSLLAFTTYFVKEGGDPKAHDVTRGHVNGFMDWRRRHRPKGTLAAKAVSARTIAKDRVVLHVIFAFAEGLEVVPSNPVARTDAPKGDTREPVLLTPDQYKALLDACEGRPMLKLYTLVLGETGLRCDSEALWLRWDDVDLDRGLLNVESVRKGRRTKSGKSRRVPMTPRLVEAMRTHMAAFRLRTYQGERTPWVFHHDIDRRHAKAGERIASLRRAFAGAVDRAKLPADLNQHDLRHRRVTTWLAEGKPAHIVQKAMGTRTCGRRCTTNTSSTRTYCSSSGPPPLGGQVQPGDAPRVRDARPE